MMNQYKKLNNLLGWIVFAIASVVYIMTAEPTVSLWDCGEYIATAYKLQVGHPPGAPFFQLLGNFFTLFAFGNEALVARMVNYMSALSSSATILFLFWSITHLAKKLIVKEEKLEGGNMIAVLMSGAVGALAYTFSDSFWFSAVEGEVYAMSSFFTAIVFWAILKWEDSIGDAESTKKTGYRWLLLIAYLVGLSVGVHLLNLLAIPAITLVYYFKKHKPTVGGFILVSILSILILASVMYVIIPFTVKIAGGFERFFVNGLGMPFHSGTIVYFIFVVGLIGFGLWFTQKKKKLVANTVLLAFTFIVIGYSSFFILVIRSNANTPIDENNPEDAISLLSYLNREQYGDWPLLHGQYFNAPVTEIEDMKPLYSKSFAVVDKGKLVSTSKLMLGDKGLVQIFRYEQDAEKFLASQNNPKLSIIQKYVVTDERKSRVYVYDERFTTLFPRMWSTQRANHPGVYKTYMTDKSNRVTVNNPQTGKPETRIIPSFKDNLSFFFKYQVGHMYMRYFMWNFSGRQNDFQGHRDQLHGNWISGIDFIDEARLGNMDQKEIPVELQNNKAHNKYYMIPLILGLIGLFFQMSRQYKDGIVVIALFLMTGLAIVIYLNQYPYQPRERDYAYAASFYAFAIWIGLGVFAIYDGLKKYVNPKATAAVVGVTSLLLVPGIMASENWDDHDRSGRYNALNIAKNYLNSCEKNAILFTNGDNDTFPLWYAQEVEGIRTDIKIVNLSLFNTDWYVDQMVRKTYDAEPIPFTKERKDYIQGTNDVGEFYENLEDKEAYNDIRKVMDFYFSSNPNTQLDTRFGKKMNYLPTKNISIPVDKKKMIANGTVAAKDSALIVDAIEWRIKERMLQKNHMMMLEMLASFNWDRPVYYAITTGDDAYLHLEQHFQLDGMAYRLVPIKTTERNSSGTYGHVNTDVLYENLMNKFKYDGINDPSLYFDESHMRSIMNYRSNFSRLATALIAEGKNEKAVKVLDYCLEVLPEETVPYNYFMIGIADAYFKAGETEKGKEVGQRIIEIYTHDLYYYYGDMKANRQYMNEKRNALYILQETERITRQNGQEDLSKLAMDALQRFGSVFQQESSGK